MRLLRLMKKNYQIIPLCTAVMLMLFASRLAAVEPLPLARDYWRSDGFVKAFNGSYRINARLEPYVDTPQRKLLIEVQKLMAKGQRKAALSKLKASPLAKSSAAIMYNIGNIAFELGNLELAEKQYRAAIKKFPSFRRAIQNLAFVLSNQEKYRAALPLLTEAVRLGAQDGSVLGLLGYCQQQDGNFTAALQAFKMAQLTEPENADWIVGEAYCHQALGENRKALNLYERLLKRQPNDARTTRLLANLYRQLGHDADALAALEWLRRTGKLEAHDLLTLGELHLQTGCRKLGIALIKKQLATAKKLSTSGVLDLIQRLIMQRELALAEDFLHTIQPALRETKQSQFQRLAAWIMLETDREEQGVKMLEEIIKKHPLDADSLYLLARHHDRNNHPERALLLYQQASHGKGAFKPAASLARAKLLVKMLRYDDAIQQLTTYLKSHPSADVRQYLEAVKKLQAASESKNGN